jgi:hypothetical protein
MVNDVIKESSIDKLMGFLINLQLYKLFYAIVLKNYDDGFAQFFSNLFLT